LVNLRAWKYVYIFIQQGPKVVDSAPLASAFIQLQNTTNTLLSLEFQGAVLAGRFAQLDVIGCKSPLKVIISRYLDAIKGRHLSNGDK